MRDGIIIEKINQFPARGFDGGIALDRRLPAARDDDFQFLTRIIEQARGVDRRDFEQVRLRRNDDGDRGQFVAHGGKTRVQSSKFKVQSWGATDAE